MLRTCKIILGSFSLISLFSCATARQTKQLNWHNQTLQRVVQSPLSGEKKLDTLAISFIQMMDEGLGIINPKKGLAYVTKYTKQNEKTIDLLLNEIGAWQNDLSTMEKISFGIRLIQKPYAKDFVDLVGKFERKYKQVKFVMDLSKKVKIGMLDAGLKGLGL